MAKLAEGKMARGWMMWAVVNPESGEIFGKYRQYRRCLDLIAEIRELGSIDTREPLVIHLVTCSDYRTRKAGLCGQDFRRLMKVLRGDAKLQKAGV